MYFKILHLRMTRQHILKKANESEYLKLYRDCQPGQNVYWNGFGDPPSLSFRADFNDVEFNRKRQRERKLIKGRFAGNIGWILLEDIELFAALYRKPLTYPTELDTKIFDLIKNAGPFNIQQIKEETGLLVKEITPILHRLQEAFLIYEDQYDGEWDRAWYRFNEIFPSINLEKFKREEALQVVIRRFAYRMVWFDKAMVKSFYKLPDKDIKKALTSLVDNGVLLSLNDGYILRDDINLLNDYGSVDMNFTYAVHRNDILYKSHEHLLKGSIKDLTEKLEYDHEPLQYLLIDGEFHGATIGHFRNGPYDLNDVICDLPNADDRMLEIVNAVQSVNYGKMPMRFNGKEIKNEYFGLRN